MGQDGFYFSSEGRSAEDSFFALKNSTASAGFELANFGSKGQHATCRPPKQRDFYLLNKISVTHTKVKKKKSNRL
jgi:hypothetical protein